MPSAEPIILARGLPAFASRFWAGELRGPGRLLGLLLKPVEVCFAAGVALRSSAYDRGLLRSHTAPIPVVSVGNLTVGGEGKTPFAAFLVDELLHRHARPVVLHGGHAPDEPVLHRHWHPEIGVYAGKDRLAAADRAFRDGAQIAILDDGFQHRRIRRDLDIVLVATERWQERPRLLPNGPWREPVAALRRADLVVVTRRIAPTERAEAVAVRVARVTPQTPIVVAAIFPAGWRVGALAVRPPEGPALAVAAIAMPEVFAASAREAGADVEQVMAFRDHHDYSAADVARILREGRGRAIVTTEKDAVKLAALAGEARLWVLTQSVRIERGADELRSALDRVLP